MMVYKDFPDNYGLGLKVEVFDLVAYLHPMNMSLQIHVRTKQRNKTLLFGNAF